MTSPSLEWRQQRYIVDAELSRGGMGVVYGARERATGRSVALKQLKGEFAGDPALRALFEREYRSLVQLQHPRILQVYDYGVDEAGPYFAMELLDGKDLADLAPLPYDAACRHLRDVASSLALLHARRLLYRDLNPRNVRLTKDRRAKLVDFGAVVPFGVADRIVGTPCSVAPEAMNGEVLDAGTDLYAFGALLYTSLTGRTPYSARTLDDLPEIFRGPPCEPPSTYAPSVPVALDELVLSLLSRDRLARPRSAAEVIERLNAIAGLESEAHGAVAQGYLANPQLVFREQELGQLRRVIDRAINGQPGSAFVQGEAGSGRTRIFEEIAIEAQLRGATVLRASGSSDRGPFGIIRRLGHELVVALPDEAREAARERSEIAALFPEFGPVGGGASTGATDVGEQHARLKDALLHWFLDVARNRPLVLIVDDADVADDDSSVLLEKIKREATEQKLAVLATQPIAHDARGGTRRRAGNIRLRSFSVEVTGELSRSIFGPVENTTQLGYRLHERTEGNPRQCLELIRQLIAEGVVTYLNGKWHVPAEVRDTSLPSGMYELYARRLATLSEPARSLAGVLSVETRLLSVEASAALANLDPDLVAPLLDELVSGGVLLPAWEDYRFSHRALQTFLYERLGGVERETAHRRAAQYLLALPEKDALSDFDAAWHLVRGGDETRGAQLLVRASFSMWKTHEGLRHVAPGLEAALEIFDRTNQPEHAKFAALQPLMLAGWYVDRRYAVAYGARALAVAFRMTGFEEGNRLTESLGPQAALMTGLSAASARYDEERTAYLTPQPRKPSFELLFGALVGIYTLRVGSAITCGDTEALDECLRAGALMTAFGEGHILGIFHEYARLFAAILRGRFFDAEPIAEKIYAWLDTPAALKSMREELFVRQYRAGILNGLVMGAVQYSKNDVLARTDELESLSLKTYESAVNYTRCAYHTFRGEVREAAVYRAVLDQAALLGEGVWQTTMLLPHQIGPASILSTDISALQQAADEIEQMSRDVPTLALSARVLRAGAHLLRGDPTRAESLLADDVSEFAAFRHFHWHIAGSVYARALIALGRPRESLDVCRRLMSEVPAAERLNYCVGYLEITLALSEAELGDTERADRRLVDLFEAFKEGSGALIVALIHEARARVAVIDGDEPRYTEHADAMERLARAVQNPSLIAQWLRLTHHAQRSFRNRHPSTAPRAVMATDEMVSILGPVRSLSDPRTAIALAMERTGAVAGALYAGRPPHAVLLATSPEAWAPPAPGALPLVDAVARLDDADANFTDVHPVVSSEIASFPPDEAHEHLSCYPLFVPHAGGWKVMGLLALLFEGPPLEVEHDVRDAITLLVHGWNAADDRQG